MLEISVLGAVEVRRDGRPVAVPGGKTAELLVRLALDAGTRVSTDRLIDDLWTGTRTNRNTLQSKAARLRRALGDPSLLVGDEDGYVLAVEPDAVDALRLLAGAGPPFEGELLPSAGDWAAPYRTRIEEARIKLLETRLAADPVIVDLESAVAQHPYQERLWELLITALYQAGRQADALAAYQRVRVRLDADLGLEPGPGLKALERQVLDQSLPSPGNLPALTTELVGRDAEVAAVRALLATSRVVEILGPGGVGKTALAIATGRALSGAVWLARLEAAQTESDVLDTVIAALHVPGGETALRARLRRDPAVLILDNCEHVLAAATALAERLLTAAPGLRILCTSQVSLELGTVFELGPLGLADAAELFTLRAARPGSTEDVTELCRSLDGLPLAIELAAARTRTLAVPEIARRLDDRFGVLRDPASRKPERRRALKATIGWSYDLLFPDDQRGLWALAAFSGGASLPAVESVLEALEVPRSAAIDIVGRLASRSLLVVDGNRYRLLDSIRAFALEEAELGDRAHDAHSAWYAAAAARSTEGVRSAEQAEYLAFARAERANIDAALAWCAEHNPERGLAIATGFGWAWIVLGDHRGAQRLLAVPDSAEALLLAAWIEASSGHLDPARDHIEAARKLGGLDAQCDYYLAYVVSHRGEWEHALDLTARAREGLTDPWEQAANALFAARAAISAGDVARAAQARDDVQHWLQQVDDPWLHVRRDAMLGELARVEHRFDDAVDHIGRAAETSGRLGFAQTEAYQLSSLGRAQCQAGDYETGAATLQHAIAKAEATGDVRLAALARVHLGRVLRALSRTDEARTALEAAAAFHREAGGGEQAVLGDTLLAALDGAQDRLTELLDQAHDNAAAEIFALDALARLTGDDALLHAADERMRAASHFITERDRVDADAARRRPTALP